MSGFGDSFHKNAEHRRHAALQSLAIATAIAVVCALPDDDFDLFISSTNLQLKPLDWRSIEMKTRLGRFVSRAAQAFLDYLKLQLSKH